MVYYRPRCGLRFGQGALCPGDGRSVGEMEIAGKRRRSFELHDFDLRAEQGDGRAARPHAGHPRGDRLAEVVRRRTSKRARIMALLKPCPDEALKIWPVDRMVGNVRNNGPQLILPVANEVLA